MIYTDTYLLFDRLVGVRNNQLDGYSANTGSNFEVGVKLLKRTMKSETRTVFVLFLPLTKLLPLNSAGE